MLLNLLQKCITALLFFPIIYSYPTIQCPEKFKSNGTFQDLVVLMDHVSWEEEPNSIVYQGVCSDYYVFYEKDGLYDTRMRIYRNHKNDVFITFRPTQQTLEGGQIHVNRRLVPCKYMNSSCKGLIHERFQEAFLSLIDDSILHQILNDPIYIGGHSLGGAFSIFMGTYFDQVFHKTPIAILGLAGPFIGDETFHQHYQISLFEKLNSSWYQIESINNYNTQEFDGTVEGYNVDTDPFIYIYHDAICGIGINKLYDSYGMHDLRNYDQYFKGTEC